DTLEQDLRRRDLTINAIAQELDGSVAGAKLVDPCGGVADLNAGVLRAAGRESFDADPLRVLRLARIAAQLGFQPELQTRELALAAAPRLTGVAAERVFAELCLLVASDRVVEGIQLAGEIGATGAVLPELEALRGVQQSPYHHLDVYDHTLAVLSELVAIERDPEAFFPGVAGELLGVLAQPLANGLTRGQALRFGALMHDIAKPSTRDVTADGRITFFDHHRVGVTMATAILTGLRASERLVSYVSALTRHHLRLGFLVHERPLSRRALYDYLAACEPVGVDVSVLSVADRLATRGRNHERAISAHLQLAQEVMPDALAWQADRPRPPIAGDELARALQIRPGPRLGALLAELAAASYAHEFEDREELLAHARRFLLRDGEER
ncbi:MAG: HDIG domain-containing metalloprotein, partial [Solirubrobacteraceae bacterium]